MAFDREADGRCLRICSSPLKGERMTVQMEFAAGVEAIDTGGIGLAANLDLRLPGLWFKWGT